MPTEKDIVELMNILGKNKDIINYDSKLIEETNNRTKQLKITSF